MFTQMDLKEEDIKKVETAPEWFYLKKHRAGIPVIIQTSPERYSKFEMFVEPKIVGPYREAV